MSNDNSTAPDLDDSFLSPFTKSSSPPKVYHQSKSPKSRVSPQKTLDNVLTSEQHDQKLHLFGFIVDVDIFTDTSVFFQPSFSKVFKNLFI